MFKKLIPLLLLLTVFAAFLLVGCDDSGNSTAPPTTGGKPNIQFKAGSVFYYGTDSVSQNGTYHPTNWRTKDSVQSETSFNGKNCFPINSVTVDTSTVPPLPIQSQVIYVSYDTGSGQFYQWGIKKLFDPSQTETWDLVADFSKPLETVVSLFTITNVFGNPNISATVTSKVWHDTTIATTGSPSVNVNCYTVNVTADVIAFTISIGKVYLDYYIGYTPSGSSNPTCRVRVKLYPVSLTGFAGGDGIDQKLNRFFVP